ncbi:hypothetical protein OEZ86_003319 [Tetradesmus obliquus]|nr:hypothetical protein OEZ86_003319 [Tetradesmus obliquus]
MGIVGSKDEAGKVILGNLPPGFLDKKGLELRDTLDACLEKNMWFFSIGGLLLTIPICIKFRTERPFFVAAVTCPFADMYFGTLRCDHPHWMNDEQHGAAAAPAREAQNPAASLA